MAGTFEQSMEQSRQDFQRIILPILQGLYPNSEIIHTEAMNDSWFKFLDIYSGVDVLLINHEKKIMQGIASRIQRSDKCFETFTIRLERDNCSPTEFFKRQEAMQRGIFYPSLTYQAYIDPFGKQLIGMAIAHTNDILNYIVEEKPLIKHTNSNQFGQASFYVIYWHDFSQSRQLVVIRPASKGYIVTWRGGKKLLKSDSNE